LIKLSILVDLSKSVTTRFSFESLKALYSSYSYLSNSFAYLSLLENFFFLPDYVIYPNYDSVLFI